MSIRFTLIAIVFSFLLKVCEAQKRDTIIYYLKAGRKIVPTSKDSAEYVLAIFPPDTNVDKKLFIVEELYKTGKRKMIGTSTVNDVNLKFEGPQISFYPNGRKMGIANFSGGKLLGDITEYYPNGKLYNLTHVTADRKQLFIECRDSTGSIMAQKGRGEWIIFTDDSVKNDYIKGKIENNSPIGNWIGYRKDEMIFTIIYNKGIVENQIIYNEKVYEKMVHLYQKAEFPGGPNAFKRYITINTQYPEAAKLKGTIGEVRLSFAVGEDGFVNNIKVIKGIGDGCDEEAIRVLQQSPHWMPAKEDGDLAPEFHNVSIAFPSPQVSANKH